MDVNGTLGHMVIGAIAMTIGLIFMRDNFKAWFFAAGILITVELTQIDVFKLFHLMFSKY